MLPLSQALFDLFLMSQTYQSQRDAFVEISPSFPPLSFDKTFYHQILSPSHRQCVDILMSIGTQALLLLVFILFIS